MLERTSNSTNAAKVDRDQNVRELIPRHRIGLENLPYQIVKQHLSQGITFNIMCIGETGIGKSTLISSLFNTELDTYENVHKHLKVTLKSEIYNLQEKGVSLQLTVVETVGYGDQIVKENSFEPILSYIDSQFNRYLKEELNPRRQLALLQDTRIHACLYFICPTGHSLKSLDIICMKQLDKKVNIIPLIAKADTLTKNELQEFKSNIRNELEKENIQIYRFPTDEDPFVDEANSMLNNTAPFAVVGSTEFVVRDGSLVRGRKYPWGSVYVRNKDHSDTAKLLEGIIETNLEDLKEQTHFKHYETYRREHLEAIASCSEDAPLVWSDEWNQRLEELQKEFQRQEDEYIQAYVEKTKRFEQNAMREENEIKDKGTWLEEKTLAQERELAKKAQLLDLEIDMFHKFVREKELVTKGGPTPI